MLCDIGIMIGHVSPEAQAGGPMNGDVICINAATRSLEIVRTHI